MRNLNLNVDSSCKEFCIKIVQKKRIHKTYFRIMFLCRLNPLNGGTIHNVPQGSLWERVSHFNSLIKNNTLNTNQEQTKYIPLHFPAEFPLKVREKMCLSTKESGSKGKIQYFCVEHRVLKYLNPTVILWGRKMSRTGEFLLRIRKRDGALFTPIWRYTS